MSVLQMVARACAGCGTGLSLGLASERPRYCGRCLEEIVALEAAAWTRQERREIFWAGLGGSLVWMLAGALALWGMW